MSQSKKVAPMLAAIVGIVVASTVFWFSLAFSRGVVTGVLLTAVGRPVLVLHGLQSEQAYLMAKQLSERYGVVVEFGGCNVGNGSDLFHRGQNTATASLLELRHGEAIPAEIRGWLEGFR
jgi:hypothetical protein